MARPPRPTPSQSNALTAADQRSRDDSRVAFGPRDFPVNREVEDECGKQEHHFDLKGFAGVTLHRFRQKQHDSRNQNHDQTPRMPMAPDPCATWVIGWYFIMRPAQPQVEDEHRAKKNRQRKQVKCFNDGKVNA